MGFLIGSMSGLFMTSAKSDPIHIMITCMSVLHVMSDITTHPDRIMWHSTADHIHGWLQMHVPTHMHEHVHNVQHVWETQVIVSVINRPSTLRYWLSQAATCQHTLVHMMSLHT